MPETDVLTYDQTPPRRPVLDDLHGGLLENRPGAKAPGPDHPNALGMNQSDKQVVALGNVAQCVRIEVHISGGTPAIFGVWGLPTGLETSDFLVTDNGAGDTSITHTGGLLPAAQWGPTAHVLGDAGDTTINVESISHGWRIRTRTGGTLTDNKNFLLSVSGL